MRPHGSCLRDNGAVIDPAPSIYRLAPAVAARLVGLGFVALAVLAFGLTVLAVRTSLSPDLIIVFLVVGLLAVIGVGNLLRSRYGVRLDDVGYSVRLVRGAGVKDGLWSEVTEAAAGRPRDVPCVVLKRTDGTTTSIPVGLLAVDCDAFAADVRARLDKASGRAS
ncbi:hypothetical protein BH11ACT8_BH11ACT8_09850 [soil metagenome]